MVKGVKIFVEGGGDGREAGSACREGFRGFIMNTGKIGKMPRIVPCGSRNNAFEKYRLAVLKGEEAMLLVNGDRPVNEHCQSGAPGNWLPWVHLQHGSGDGWVMPEGDTEENCHLMVECMECWILVDRKSIAAFFGTGFRENALPSDKKPPESVGKVEALAGLENATRDCRTKGRYGKGEHSFELLSMIDSRKVIASCPWAARFVEMLGEKMNA